MKVGIDFGTNRIVVAAADRGNYPLVVFEQADGATADWFPSLVAVKGNELLFGWDAWNRQSDHDWTIIRSLKRLLDKSGPHTLLDLQPDLVPIASLLHGLVDSLLHALRNHSNLHLAPDEPVEAMVGVPANSNSNQRFLTLEAFRAAGFTVLGLLNEPSAASIEFAHKQARKSALETILVYDLGGGTFDASLVAVQDGVHHVIASAGISSIGGDDFDHVLADVALEEDGVAAEASDTLSPGEWFRLLEECRQKKESLNPNSKRLVIDLEQVHPEWHAVTIPVSDFYEQVRPLVDETIEVTEQLASEHGGMFDALYITGGGSELPLVARALKEQFGRRVRRSAYTRSATAIGLAIQAGSQPNERTGERLHRYFGVWREAEHGSRIVFDALFEKGEQLPADGVRRISRSYSPAHNIGHFRFVECSHRAGDGSPTGEVTVWDEVHFPFDPDHESTGELGDQQVVPSEQAKVQCIEEVYECDGAGFISVQITNHSSGFSQRYQLGRWRAHADRRKQFTR